MSRSIADRRRRRHRPGPIGGLTGAGGPPAWRPAVRQGRTV